MKAMSTLEGYSGTFEGYAFLMLENTLFRVKIVVCLGYTLEGSKVPQTSVRNVGLKERGGQRRG
eukprot:1889162-Rhodomonas_salina.1